MLSLALQTAEKNSDPTTAVQTTVPTFEDLAKTERRFTKVEVTEVYK